MRTKDLDHLLETAVAQALGLSLPSKLGRRMVPARKAAHQIKHAA